MDFNPRSQGGATWTLVLQRVGAKISIHAPKGERQDVLNLLDGLIEFQSTLPRGSDLLLRIYRRMLKNFNPRSQGGATPNKTCRDGECSFQSTLPRGSDSCSRAHKDKLRQISIHAPKGERLLPPLTTPPAFQFQSTLPRGSDRPAL